MQVVEFSIAEVVNVVQNTHELSGGHWLIISVLHFERNYISADLSEPLLYICTCLIVP